MQNFSLQWLVVRSFHLGILFVFFLPRQGWLDVPFFYQGLLDVPSTKMPTLVECESWTKYIPYDVTWCVFFQRSSPFQLNWRGDFRCKRRKVSPPLHHHILCLQILTFIREIDIAPLYMELLGLWFIIYIWLYFNKFDIFFGEVTNFIISSY